MWIVGEDMPQETNRVTLNTDVKDDHGMPVPNVHYDDHPNDVAMRNHAYGQGEALYEAVGATRTFPTPPYPSTHNLGTNRMSENPRDGVVNRYGQSHDIPNLFVSDGSQFTTGGAENPTLTIVALAIRQADHVAGELSKGDSTSAGIVRHPLSTGRCPPLPGSQDDAEDSRALRRPDPRLLHATFTKTPEIPNSGAWNVHALYLDCTEPAFR